jgi:hypothetical protein
VEFVLIILGYLLCAHLKRVLDEINFDQNDKNSDTIDVSFTGEIHSIDINFKLSSSFLPLLHLTSSDYYFYFQGKYRINIKLIITYILYII